MKHPYLAIRRVVWERLMICLMTLLPVSLRAAETSLHPLRFKQLSAPHALPTNEVQKVYQDKDGFMWFATRSGLCRYDGYETTLYKSNLYSPELLTNNSVTCLADDEQRVWIGTSDGLNALDKRTGQMRKYLYPEIPNHTISAICVTRDGTVWVGTDNGLCRYNPQRDLFEVPGTDFEEGVLMHINVKSLVEDSDGDLWIGTWSQGLLRYVPATGRVVTYPPINERHSVHVVFEDSDKNIWVGSWGCGLFRLEHPKDMERVSYTNYRHRSGQASSLSDNIVYDISEDRHTRSLWVGTRSGLSILSMDAPEGFVNYRSGEPNYHIPTDEINSIVRDAHGNMWIGTIGGGVLMTNTRPVPFSLHALSIRGADIPLTSVRSLFADSGGNLWIGAGSYGLAFRDGTTGELRMYSQMPEFAGISTLPSLVAMTERRKSGEMWLGIYNSGIYVFRKGQQVQLLTVENTDFIPSYSISALHEDYNGNCWVGTRSGLGVALADGRGYRFGTMEFADNLSADNFNVRDILREDDHSLWVATSNWGVIHITGHLEDPNTLRYENYSLHNRRLSTNNALCLHLDRFGRLWLGTEGGGLYRYDREQRRFDEMNRTYGIPGDAILSIEEDKGGGLWMATGSELINLRMAAVGTDFSMRAYTAADGLQENFIVGSSCNSGGKLFFGGHQGYNSFVPEEVAVASQETNFRITDIKVFNHPFATLPVDVRQRISTVVPTYADRIELPHRYNNFSIEFAALTYRHPELNRYAYRLVGFDREWQYTDAARRFAYYNNLPAGTYTFQLKTTNENGIWSGYVRELTVVVLPPFWQMWWAYLLYVAVAAGLVYLFYRATRNRILLRNELRLREMERAKAEELNHAKLQFFTNVTHELLTPLTIISATVDELRMQAPGHDEIYDVMHSNIQRLIRLLQQILEFRKAETGNLRLRISQGDIAAFVRREAESFRPLIKKRKIHFSVLCHPESIVGYFDSDKLDKILYNLLSNAAKYSREGGFIQVTLTYDENKDYVSLRVKDNGEGISHERQKHLFKRFYEGDHRKFNTIGTGIGLSLTKDLVTLHEGTITVESEEGRGTEFIVRLPADRSYYRADQIDDEAGSLPAYTLSDTAGEPEPEPVEEPAEYARTSTAAHAVLVVEDNEELLQLMQRLLHRDYRVFTAENGKEAIALLETEEIDLIVTDVMMPVMDGIALCRYVKEHLEMSHIPVILLTAKSKEEDRAEAYEVGADAFIAKPFNLAVLHARIRNLLKYKERMAHDFKNQLVFEIKDLNYTSLDEDFMQRAIDCVNNHLADTEFDQPQFAEAMCTSKSTLYKKLKSLTGLSTSAFIRNVRMKAACRIMEEKGAGVRVSELAYAVGFGDPKYFSSCFKKEFGMLPSEYMEQFVGDGVQE